MARTVVGVNDPKAVKKYSSQLMLDVSQDSYWNQRFMGRGETASTPIQVLTDLESDAGEEIKYDLLAELRMSPVEGDDVLEGKEEAQRFYTDSVYIDQARAGVNTGGRMTRKRTIHNLRVAPVHGRAVLRLPVGRARHQRELHRRPGLQRSRQQRADRA